MISNYRAITHTSDILRRNRASLMGRFMIILPTHLAIRLKKQYSKKSFKMHNATLFMSLQMVYRQRLAKKESDFPADKDKD